MRSPFSSDFHGTHLAINRSLFIATVGCTSGARYSSVFLTFARQCHPCTVVCAQLLTSMKIQMTLPPYFGDPSLVSSSCAVVPFLSSISLPCTCSSLTAASHSSDSSLLAAGFADSSVKVRRMHCDPRQSFIYSSHPRLLTVRQIAGWTDSCHG